MVKDDIYIVLANLMNKKGILNTESKNRVDALLRSINNKKNQKYNILRLGI